MVSCYIKFNHNSYCQLQKLEWKQCKISANIAKIIHKLLHFVAKKRAWMKMNVEDVDHSTKC